MPEDVTGGCRRGAVRHRLSGPVARPYICHCTECQKQSASAFGKRRRMTGCPASLFPIDPVHDWADPSLLAGTPRVASLPVAACWITTLGKSTD